MISKIFLLGCLAAVAYSLPLESLNPEDGVHAVDHTVGSVDYAYQGEGEHHERTKRATCDLLSFKSKWLTVNDSACAAHCIAMFKGYKGGYCRNSICHCRK